MTTTEKTCIKCKTLKPITEFYVHPQMGDGRLGKCKECMKQDVSANYRDNIEHYKAYERERFNKPERKIAVIKYQRERRERNPDKYKARTAVGNAIRDGRMVRQPCEMCGAAKTQAHHDDYSRPLDVRWLCFVCHRKVHGQLDYEGAA